MKIRIKGNSIRIRLTRGEVDTLAATGFLQEKTQFANQDFMYSLSAKEGIQNLEAEFDGSNMTMYVPADIPAIWAANDVVGYDHNMDTGNGRKLYLLLEKDFKCIDAVPGEDQSDNFENPHKAC